MFNVLPTSNLNDLRAGAATDAGYVFAGAAQEFTKIAPDMIQLVRTDAVGKLVDGGITAVRPKGTAEVASAHAVVVEADGHVLVGGFAQFSGIRCAAIARFDAAGRIDTSFGVDGFVFVDFGKPAEVKRLALQANAVIAAIVTTGSVDGRDVVLMRIKP